MRAWMEDGRALWAPCLAWAPGPTTLASTGDGAYPTLYGSNWLLQICNDGSWVLYRRDTNETLTVVPWDVTPPVAGLTARHPTLAFDQAARPAIAWEDDNGIRLREYDEVNGAYHFVGPFDGHDPVLICDATVNYHVPDSDVVLFYLDADRETLCYRVQSENFATEHEHHTFSDPPVTLDLSDIGGFRLQLRYSDEHGAVIDEGDSFRAILSDVYPIYVQDELAGSLGLIALDSHLAATLYSPDAEGVDASLASMSFELHEMVIPRHPDPDNLDASLGSMSFALPLVVLHRTPDGDGVDGTLGAAAFESALAAFKRTPPTEAIDGALGAMSFALVIP